MVIGTARLRSPPCPPEPSQAWDVARETTRDERWARWARPGRDREHGTAGKRRPTSHVQGGPLPTPTPVLPKTGRPCARTAGPEPLEMPATAGFVFLLGLNVTPSTPVPEALRPKTPVFVPSPLTAMAPVTTHADVGGYAPTHRLPGLDRTRRRRRWRSRPRRWRNRPTIGAAPPPYSPPAPASLRNSATSAWSRFPLDARRVRRTRVLSCCECRSERIVSRPTTGDNSEQCKRHSLRRISAGCSRGSAPEPVR